MLRSASLSSKNIEIDNIAITVTRRKTKSLRVVVHPPYGEVRVSVPNYVSNLLVREFILERIDWIKTQREFFLSQAVPQYKVLENGSTIRFFDAEMPLQIVTANGRSGVRLKVDSMEQKRLVMQVKPDSSFDDREKLLMEWYRKELKRRVPELIEKWQKIVGVEIDGWGIKRMKTRWGSCNISDRRIWINLELAKKPTVCLEYVILHELTHLIERLHSKKFWNLIERFMPDWRVAEGHLK